jgi:hypothetical protein
MLSVRHTLNTTSLDEKLQENRAQCKATQCKTIAEACRVEKPQAEQKLHQAKNN